MAHQIEGNRIAYVGKTPWHRIGVKLHDEPTVAEAMKAAQMDWDVIERPLFLGAGAFGSEDVVPTNDVIATHKSIVRASDGKVLGVVGADWTPIQNREAFSFFDPFLESKQASLETCGVLKEGSRIWVLAKLNRDPLVITPGDAVQKYVLLANSHDGSLAVRVGFTPVRVVCANTLGAAMSRSDSRLLKLRHSKNVKANLDVVQGVLNAADASFEATAEQYRRLAQFVVDPGDVEKYVKLVFPRQARRGVAAADSSGELPAAPESGDDFASLLARPVGSKVDAEEAAAKEEEKQSRYVGKITELFENPVGGVVKGSEGTYWQLYNAITAFTSHVRSRSDEATINALLGDGAAINRRALDIAVQLVNDKSRAA